MTDDNTEPATKAADRPRPKRWRVTRVLRAVVRAIYRRLAWQFSYPTTWLLSVIPVLCVIGVALEPTVGGGFIRQGDVISLCVLIAVAWLSTLGLLARPRVKRVPGTWTAPGSFWSRLALAVVLAFAATTAVFALSSALDLTQEQVVAIGTIRRELLFVTWAILVVVWAGLFTATLSAILRRHLPYRDRIVSGTLPSPQGD